MPKVILTIDNTRNAYILLKLIKQFDFVYSVELDSDERNIESEDEIFTNDLSEDFFLEDLNMTVKEFRLQTIQDEQEPGMSKSEFLKSLKEWRKTIEK